VAHERELLRLAFSFLTPITAVTDIFASIERFYLSNHMYCNPTRPKVLTWLSPCLLQDNGPAALCTFLQNFRSCKLSLRLGGTLLALTGVRRTWVCTNDLKYLEAPRPRGFATLVLAQEDDLCSSIINSSACLICFTTYVTPQPHPGHFLCPTNPVITSVVALSILVEH
jgi:hypothetical protein